MKLLDRARRFQYNSILQNIKSGDNALIFLHLSLKSVRDLGKHQISRCFA